MNFLNVVDLNEEFLWSSENGHLEVVKFLVDHGADVRAKDDCALKWASRNGNLEVVKFLKSKMK